MEESATRPQYGTLKIYVEFAVKVSTVTVLCTVCGKLIHKQCSGVKGSLGRFRILSAVYVRLALLSKMN